MLSRGLYLSYQPGPETTLTVYRLNTFPAPLEIKIIIDILIPLVGMPTRQEYETNMRHHNGKQYGCAVLAWATRQQQTPFPLEPKSGGNNYAYHN